MYNAYNILQLLHLIIKGNIRVDPRNVKNSEIKEFDEQWRRQKNHYTVFILTTYGDN